MKKLLTILSLTLCVALATASCSDSKDSKESTKTNGKKKTSETKDRSSFDNDDETDFDSDVTSAAFDADVELMKSNVAASCAEMKVHYDLYKTTGNTSDGFDEILEIRYMLPELGAGITEGIDVNSWDYDNDIESEYIEDVVNPFSDKLYALGDQLEDVVEAAINESASSAQLQKIHDILSETEAYINGSEFGPCSFS